MKSGMLFLKKPSGILLLLAALGLSTVCAAQQPLKRNFICITPSKARQANGLSIGLWNYPKTRVEQHFNGLNIEVLGYGWLSPFLGLDDAQYDKIGYHRINGVSLGLTLLSGQMNGFSFSPTINTTFYSNGVKLGLVNYDLNLSQGVQLGIINLNSEQRGLCIGLFNNATRTRGLQIGLVNRSEELKGLQIGLINIRGGRALPLVNWGNM